MPLAPPPGYRCDNVNPFDTSELLKARDRLLAGDVVAIPTETVYGLAASIESEAGLRKIFATKERPFFDPLIVHVASFAQARTLVKDWPPVADFLARFFWPGPLTIVLPKAETVNPLITSGLSSVAIRYPSHPVAQDLIKLAAVPLAAPSANKFGKTSPSRAEHVRAEFPGIDLLVLDGGDCEVGVESTVVEINVLSEDESEVRILRPGGVTEEMIRETLEKFSRSVRVVRAESPVAPGHLKHHYMPPVPLVILPEDEPTPLSLRRRTQLQSDLKTNELRNTSELVLNQDPEQAARELYSEMRRLAEEGADLLFIRAPRDRSGLWSAIWDRLTRAASLNLS